jgi:hypothetical protein
VRIVNLRTILHRSIAMTVTFWGICCHSSLQNIVATMDRFFGLNKTQISV